MIKRDYHNQFQIILQISVLSVLGIHNQKLGRSAFQISQVVCKLAKQNVIVN